MKEIFRSFDRKLSVDNRSGYIIYDLKDFWEIEFISVLIYQEDSRVRIRKDLLPQSDFGDMEKIAELREEIENGNSDSGQAYFRGKWYGYDIIAKIQNNKKDYNWKRYV